MRGHKYFTFPAAFSHKASGRSGLSKQRSKQMMKIQIVRRRNLTQVRSDENFQDGGGGRFLDEPVQHSKRATRRLEQVRRSRKREGQK